MYTHGTEHHKMGPLPMKMGSLPLKMEHLPMKMEPVSLDSVAYGFDLPEFSQEHRESSDIPTQLYPFPSDFTMAQIGASTQPLLEQQVDPFDTNSNLGALPQINTANIDMASYPYYGMAESPARHSFSYSASPTGNSFSIPSNSPLSQSIWSDAPIHTPITPTFEPISESAARYSFAFDSDYHYPKKMSEASSISVSRRDSKGYADNQEWFAHYETIKQLYIIEDRPLKEVMQIMRDQYNFKATEKMYKIKIKTWHLKKNLREGEVQAIVQRVAEREAEGKTTHSITIYDNVFEYSQIRRHARKKGLLGSGKISKRRKSSAQSSFSCDSSLPSYIKVSTPRTEFLPEHGLPIVNDGFMLDSQGSYTGGYPF